MDAKKIIAAVIALALGVAGGLYSFDFKKAICENSPIEKSE